MNWKIISWIVLVVILLGLMFYTFFPNIGYVVEDSFNSDNGDICAAPDGVSQEDWKEHMGHHPNIYGSCLS